MIVSEVIWTYLSFLLGSHSHLKTLVQGTHIFLWRPHPHRENSQSWPFSPVFSRLFQDHQPGSFWVVWSMESSHGPFPHLLSCWVNLLVWHHTIWDLVLWVIHCKSSDSGAGWDSAGRKGELVPKTYGSKLPTFPKWKGPKVANLPFRASWSQWGTMSHQGLVSVSVAGKLDIG